MTKRRKLIKKVRKMRAAGQLHTPAPEHNDDPYPPQPAAPADTKAEDPKPKKKKSLKDRLLGTKE
tara:strand:+ start:202 stop:396 length:195 start_codon:yes stop_codon:yes gene_type:complete